jgi:hypothetical protein
MQMWIDRGLIEAVGARGYRVTEHGRMILQELAKSPPKGTELEMAYTAGFKAGLQGAREVIDHMIRAKGPVPAHDRPHP